MSRTHRLFLLRRGVLAAAALIFLLAAVGCDGGGTTEPDGGGASDVPADTGGGAGSDILPADTGGPRDVGGPPDAVDVGGMEDTGGVTDTGGVEDTGGVTDSGGKDTGGADTGGRADTGGGADIDADVVAGCELDRDCGAGGTCVDHVCYFSACREHADCGFGEACHAHRVCVPAPCTTDDDCFPFLQGGGTFCDEAAGVCVSCVIAADCEYPDAYDCVAGRCVADCEDDEYAPNGARERAAAITLTDGVFAAPDLELCGAFAEDWFTFTTAAPGPLNVIATFSHAEGDIDLGLYQGNGSAPYARADSTTDNEVITRDDAPAATWFVRVLFYERGEPTRFAQSYGLAIATRAPECTWYGDCAVGRVCDLLRCVDAPCERDAACAPWGLVCDEANGWCAACGAEADCLPLEACVESACVSTCVDDAYEENDTLATAAPLAPGSYELVLCRVVDAVEPETDWFAVDLAAGETLAVATEWENVWAAFYGADNQWIQPDWPEDGTAGIRYTAVAPETVYVQIVGERSTPYALTVVIDPECIDLMEGGDCPAGEFCDRYFCAPGCSFDPDCAAGERCLDHACAVPECEVHADCVAGEACAWYRCVAAPACDEDFDCQAPGSGRSGLPVCDLTLGACVQCAVDGDCPSGGQACVDHACVFECADDAWEENDTQATAVPLTPGTYSDLRLCTARGGYEDEDWYVVDATSGFFGVSLTFSAGDDRLDLDVVGATGGPVSYVDNCGDGECAASFPTGNYTRFWIRISATDDFAGTTYELRVWAACFGGAECPVGEACVDQDCVATSCETDNDCLPFGVDAPYVCDPAHHYCVECLADGDCYGDQVCRDGRCRIDCEEDAWEPNSTLADAAAIALPFAGTGLTLCGGWDHDWFAFDLAPDTAYAIQTLFPAASGAVYCELYGPRPDGTAYEGVAPAQMLADRAAIAYTTGADGGPFRLSVTSLDTGLDHATYDLTIREAECVVDAECGALQACLGGLCADVECVADGDCDAADLCVDHACFTPECRADGDCPPGASCVDYACVWELAGDTCANAIEFDVEGFQGEIDLAAYSNTLETLASGLECEGMGAGPDIVFAFTQGEGIAVQVEVLAMDQNFAAGVYVLDGCGTPDEACLAGGAGETADGLFLDFIVPHDGTYHAVVDLAGPAPEGGALVFIAVHYVWP